MMPLPRWLVPVARGLFRSSPDHLRTGRAGERAVVRELRRAGYRVRGRNLRTNAGEIDILAVDPDGVTMVVIEVKSGAHGPITGQRLGADQSGRLVRAANALAASNNWDDRPWRIDLALAHKHDGRWSIEHLRGVVDARGRRR